MAGPTTADQPVPPTSTTNTTCVIPGLSSQPPNNPASKRSHKKKTGSKVDNTTKAVARVPAFVDEPNELTEPAPAPLITSMPKPLNGLTPSAPPASASVSILPVQQQHIGGYESSTAPLNKDQKRAITSKPALEATVKELQDLLKILEEDEKLDEL
ncbi:uncharacterized protein PGTG_19410 [Puccinia graminis f. sp. tritici CRL 75-36-700-3]|uniref:Uncharacterized protein n=1 Tax=Puccinia graminis f. sp. tritici (strain CRL 75-36-700-3 / race SCCL) TaxID=418459 RepID=E3LA17_PUCGT|nr:uncharacterized protein PGTG_19410 [Puccinia graminis f. sp. tritici CRL 75-36-700-3]EFP93392.2 hypothetical protein PGTG_19410 [Puccinia graminis f. sp. tritici CRL 75-36-700-3]